MRRVVKSLIRPPFSTASFTAPATGGYRGRFAPSPTGPLHLGSLYTALASFLQARSVQGTWFLRIDDLDPLRTRSTATNSIRYALDALGLHWDGPVLLQSQRLDAYAEALARLTEAGLIYPCTCTRKELGSATLYPGTCRSRGDVDLAMGSHSLRIRVPTRAIVVADRLQGDSLTRLDQTTGDFIIYRRDGVFAYHLATVLDDDFLGITEILRGMDLLDVTPQQVYLRDVLALRQPSHAHIPILVDRHGIKLSKQTHAPEASTTQPAVLLTQLLILLNQNPPAELARETRQNVLDWAIHHWNPYALRGVRQVSPFSSDLSKDAP